MDMLAASGFVRGAMMFMIIVVCCLLMLVILLQKGRGEGLSGAFGGGGGSSAFGAKTGDVFTWITVCLAAVFIFLAIIGSFVFDESAGRSAVVAAPPAGPGTAPAPNGEAKPAPGTPIKIGDKIDIQTDPGGDAAGTGGTAGPAPASTTPPRQDPGPATGSDESPSQDKPPAGGDEPASPEAEEPDVGQPDVDQPDENAPGGGDPNAAKADGHRADPDPSGGPESGRD
ncbi:MAG: preprotein translocase subunit SecG [Phycisphaerae bacterium]